MAKAKKIWTPRPTRGLWRAVAVTGWLFIACSIALTLGYGYRAVLLAELPPMEPFSELDIIPGHEDEDFVISLLGLPYFVIYLIGAFLTLRWYLRSVRNAHVLHRGINTSPAWVIWYFILPIVSLFRPYTMTSELWRSSLQPEGWKSLRDPALLRWWWAFVLAFSVVAAIGNAVSRSSQTAGGVLAASVLTAIGFGFAALASVLFLRIGGRISGRQTALVAAGHRPADSTLPAWSA